MKKQNVILATLVFIIAIMAFSAYAAPTVTFNANSPANNTNSTSMGFNLNFTTVGAIDPMNCTFVHDQGSNNMGPFANNTPSAAFGSFVSPGVRTYYIRCNDGGDGVSETRTMNVDIQNVVINSIGVNETDSFYSDATENNKLTFMVNATDAGIAGIKYIIADFSELNQPGIGPINMTRIGSTDFWNATITITNVTGMNFEPKNITIATAVDNFNNTGFQTIGPGSKTVVLYDMEVPPEGPCMHWGPLTTNFSTVPNFAAVNFVLQHKANLSCITPDIPSNAPAWTHDFETVVLINFTSVDISTPGGAEKLQGLQTAFQADLVAPNHFGTSRIYFNTTYFAELNTTTTITMYHLPFASQPNIIVDPGAAGYNSSTVIWGQGTNEGNLTFRVYGFSGYNFSDQINPTIAFSTPTTNGTITTDSTPLINVTLNGTKTQITYATFAITGATTPTTLYYNLSSSLNTANCANVSLGSELFRCQFNTSTLNDGSHTLTVTAWDYGGNDPGNTASSEITFGIDTAAPVVTINNPAASSWKKANFTITVTIIDTGTLNITKYKIINSTAGIHTNWTNLTDDSGDDWTAAFAAGSETEGNYTLYINATDTMGYVNDTASAVFWVDRTNPTISSFSLSDTTPKTGDSVTGTCSATDNLGTATTAVTGISTSTTGDKTATCTATDNAGNTATSTASYTVSRTDTGGGGGGAAPAAGTSVGGSTAIVSSVASGETAEFKMASIDNLAVSAIDIAFAEAAVNARVTVNKLNELPTTITPPSEKTYQVLTIAKTNIADSAIKTADINFKVAKSWLTENNVAQTDIALFRKTEGWNELPTTVVKEDADYVYYKAATPGFSYFVIGQKAGAVTTPTTAPTVEQVPVTPPATTTPPAEEEKLPEAAAKKPMWPWYLLGLAVVGIALAIILKPRRHH